MGKKHYSAEFKKLIEEKLRAVVCTSMKYSKDLIILPCIFEHITPKADRSTGSSLKNNLSSA